VVDTVLYRISQLAVKKIKIKKSDENIKQNLFSLRKNFVPREISFNKIQIN
jgi:hypothetical protein